MIGRYGRAFFAFVCVLAGVVVVVVATVVMKPADVQLRVPFLIQAVGLVTAGGSVFIMGERARDTAEAWKNQPEPRVEPEPETANPNEADA